MKTNGTLSNQITENSLVALSNGDRVRFNWSSSGTVQIKNIQIEKGTQPTPYEPWVPGHTDIDKRLKLPMSHYFPHPVIDAIISAADGQHTEEEKEILRHYLTPLGIGGIELAKQNKTDTFPAGYRPYWSQQINLVNSFITPTTVKYADSAAYAFWLRSFYERLLSTIDFQLPEQWQ